MFLLLAGNSIQLVPDGTLLFHVLLIVAMVAVLNATLLRPINQVLEERERRTRGRLTEAQQTLDEIERKLREYEQGLRVARGEGYSLLERERAALSTEREQRVGQVREEITGYVLKEREELQVEVERARAKLKGEARTMAVQISRQILDRPISTPGPS